MVPAVDSVSGEAETEAEAAPVAPTASSRRRLVQGITWGKALSSMVDDRIDVNDDASYCSPRRAAARRSRSVLSSFSIHSIASRVEEALFDNQSRRSIHSQITEDEVDKLLAPRAGQKDADTCVDQEGDCASASVHAHQGHDQRRQYHYSSSRRQGRLSWAKNITSMVSYLTDDDEGLEDVVMDEMAQPLPLGYSVDSEEDEGFGNSERDNSYSSNYPYWRSNTRRYLAILAIAGICLATSFTAGIFYISKRSSFQKDLPIDTNDVSDQSRYEPEDPAEYHVSKALEDVLQHAQVADNNDLPPSNDIFSSTAKRKSKDIQVLVRCDEPEGCLEAMKKSSSVHVESAQDMSRVSLNVQPERFDDLRSVHGLHLDVDHIVEAIEDDEEETDGEDIDLADLIRQQNEGGSFRGRHRRAEQFVSEGFKMIQAVMDDGSPFPAGPHRKRICVADTGTCKGHPDLLSNYPKHLDGIDLVMDDGLTILRWDKDVGGHGCHNNGIIQALDDDFGYVGIQGSDVFITRGLQDDKRATVSQVMAALDQCVNAGASIIVLALGCLACQDALDESYFRSLADKGILVLAASGNTGNDPHNELMYPASFPGSVISVSAVNANETVWHKSAVNSQVEFCAHGSSVISTGFSLTNDSYQYNFVRKSGTSMSTPQVAAVAAHLWSHYPRCSATQIRSVLAATAKKVDTGSGRLEGCTHECGFGIPQLQDAYHLLESTKSFPGVSVSNDYDCDVGGMILSSTDRVCDCIDSYGDPSKCIDPSASYKGRSPLDKGPEETSTDPTLPSNLPRCKDKKGARFRINVSRERNANTRNLQSARQRRKNRPRGCKYIRKRKSRAQFWCQMNQQVRSSCKRSCSTLAGIIYNNCSI